MDILRGNSLLATVHPSDDSVYSCKLMADNVVKLNFKYSAAISMLIGDSIVYNGSTYTLNSQPTVKEVSTREFDYTCEFQAADYELKRVEYRLFDNTPLPAQGDFSLMGNARTFVQLVVDNMNRIQTGWSVGTVLDSEFRSLTFSAENCLTVLQNLAKEFNTEYYISGTKVINLQQKPFTGTILELGYGKDSGMKSLTKLKNDDSSLITSLYVFGGTRNLPLGYRNGSSRLMLPAGLPLQNNVNLYGIIEGSRVFENIYPRLSAGTGTDPGKVTAITGLFQFTDLNLDFDVNQYLTATTAKVVFITGELSGYQFEIASYVHATRTFTINAATYENNIDLPSTNFHAATGDKYVLIDIYMPSAYVTRAEAELLAQAQNYLTTCSTAIDNYQGDCDPLFFKRNSISISLGQIVRIVSVPLGIDKQKRVIGINQNLNNPYIYKLEFGDTVAGRIDTIEADIASISKSGSNSVKTLSATDSAIATLKNSSLRRYSDQTGDSKRINDLPAVTTIEDGHRFEVEKSGAVSSGYVSTAQLATYIANKYKFTYNSTLNRFEISVDLYVDGNISASKEIAAWIASAVSSDVLAGLSAQAPLSKISNSLIGLLYDTSTLAVVGGKLTVIGGGGSSLGADLTAIAALSGTSGFLKKVAAGSWTLDTATYLTAITKAMIEAQLTGAITTHTHAAYLTAITSLMVTNALGFTPYNATNPSNYLTSITKSMIEAQLTGAITTHTHSAYLTAITSLMVTTALGFTPYNATNPSNFLTAITSLMVTNALGFTPYNATNPSNYLTAITKAMIEAQLTGLITSHSHNYQAPDNDLTAIAALTGISGILRKSAADTWLLDLNLISDGYNVGVGATAPLTSKFQVAQVAAGPGTVTVAGTSVTGVGTNFTNLFKVGDAITVVTTTGSETKAITVITSDTVLTTAAFTGTASAGTAYSTVAGDRFTVKANGNTEAYGSITARSSFNLKNSAGVTKWTVQVDPSDNLQFMNASGVVECVLDQSGNLKAKGEISAYATI